MTFRCRLRAPNHRLLALLIAVVEFYSALDSASAPRFLRPTKPAAVRPAVCLTNVLLVVPIYLSLSEWRPI
jgi:hypothetical protein